MYQIENGKFFSSSLRLLRCIYALPTQDESTWYMVKFRIIYTIIRIAGFVAFVFMPGIHMSLTIKDNTGGNVSEDLSTLVGGIGAIAITVSFFLLRNKWSQLFIDLERFNVHGRKVDFEDLTKKLNFQSSLYALYTLLAVIVYAIVAANETSYCKRMNEEKGLNEICGYFTPIVLPFDGTQWFIRLPLFGLQMVLAIFVFTTAAIICFLSHEVVETMCFHLNLLKQLYLEAFDCATMAEKRERFRFCVRFHIDILSLCQRLSVLAKQTTGSLCLTSALIFATIGNFILKTKPLAGLCYLIAYIVAFFLVCHGGQRLMDETLSINDAVYNSKWYETDAATMRDICFILARSQKPITMIGMPLGVVNYSMFLMILKTSYTYLTLLNQKT